MALIFLEGGRRPLLFLTPDQRSGANRFFWKAVADRFYFSHRIKDPARTDFLEGGHRPLLFLTPDQRSGANRAWKEWNV
jgi:hypothetical protein